MSVIVWCLQVVDGVISSFWTACVQFGFMFFSRQIFLMYVSLGLNNLLYLVVEFLLLFIWLISWLFFLCCKSGCYIHLRLFIFVFLASLSFFFHFTYLYPSISYHTYFVRFNLLYLVIEFLARFVLAFFALQISALSKFALTRVRFFWCCCLVFFVLLVCHHLCRSARLFFPLYSSTWSRPL